MNNPETPIVSFPFPDPRDERIVALETLAEHLRQQLAIDADLNARRTRAFVELKKDSERLRTALRPIVELYKRQSFISAINDDGIVREILMPVELLALLKQAVEALEPTP